MIENYYSKDNNNDIIVKMISPPVNSLLNINISEEDNCFSLKILIPIPESENTSLKWVHLGRDYDHLGTEGWKG